MILGKKVLIPIIVLLLVFAAAAPVAMALNQTETRAQPLILALSLQPRTLQQPLPKQYTDIVWTNPTISDVNVSQDLNIILNGDLNITETGELRLIHCILNVNNDTTPIEYGIKVYGKMYINASSTITAINIANPYYFTVYAGATFQMNDSRVEYCGHVDGAWPDEDGLTVRADNAWIENNIITQCRHAIILYQSNGSTILNNTAIDNYLGFYLYKSYNNNLTDNKAKNNSWEGFYLYDSVDNYLTGNTATNNYYGFHLIYYQYGNNLTGNTAINNTQYGFYLESSDRNDLIDNTAINSNCGFYLYSARYNTLPGNTALNCTTGYFWSGFSTDNDFTGSVETNYLRVNVTTALGDPIQGADVEIKTDGTQIYATPYFQGTDDTTDSNGLTPWIDVPYRTFTGPTTMTENTTNVEVWNPPFTFLNNPRIVNMSVSHVETFQVTGEDLNPPVTTISLSGTEGLEGWYTSNVMANLTAIDDVSGVNITEYSYDQITWNEYTGPFPISDEGITTVFYNSTDNMGRVEATKNATIKIDKTDPTTIIDLTGTTVGEWYTSDVTVNLTATDAAPGSGVETTYYRINGGTLTNYTSVFPLNTDGIFTIEYYSVDVAGNEETAKSEIVKLDKATPVTIIDLIGTPGQGGWYLSNVTVNLTATDGVSGVNKTEYSFDQITWYEYTDPFVISDEGITTVFYNSTDNVGRVEATKNATVKIDKTAPTTTISPSGTQGQDEWYTSDVTVTLTATDSTSGVAGTEYSTNGVDWIVYTSPFPITNEGITTVNYRSTDNAGLVEATKTATVKIDKTLPVTTISLTGTSGQGGWYVSNVAVTLSATDTVTGVNKTEYSINGTGWNLYKGQFNIATEGITTIYYNSTDNAGNVEDTNSIIIKIDRTSPDITITSPSDGAILPTDDVQVNWTGSDNIGIDHYEVQIDGEGWTNVLTNENHLFTNLDDGSHTAEVRAFDQAGNSNTTSVSFTVDTTPPTVNITAPSDGAILPTRDITVIWTGGDNIALDHYEIRIDEESGIDKGTSESHDFSNLDNGLHIVYVMAFDGAGNTNTSTVSFRVDTEEPDVTITSPGDGALLTSGDVTVYWTSVATDIAYYNISIDGGDWINVGPATNHLIPGLSDNPHNVEVMAVDEAGLNDTDTVSFTVDTIPPTVNITAPLGGAFLSSGDLTVTWTGSDATSGIDYFEIRIDGGIWENMGTSNSKPYSALSEGPHTVEVVAHDKAGLTDPDSVSFTVDTSSPTVTITVPVDGAFSPVDNVEVMWTGSDAITSIDYYEMRIDGGIWENMGTSNSKPYSALSEGPHTVEVRAFDQSGNNNTDTVSFTVDTTPPTVSITSPIPDEEFNTSTVTVTWTRDDPNFDYCMYRLDSGSWHNVGSETSHIFTGLSNGSHTVEIMAVDQAGHNRTDTVSFIVNVPVSPSVIPVLVSLSLMQQQGVPMVYLMAGGAAVGAVTAVGLVLWLRRRP